MSTVAAARLCAGCARRGSEASGFHLVNGEYFCVECFTDTPVKSATVPPAMVRTARRARLYYGLQTLAARRLNVTANYVHHMLSTPPAGPRWRVFQTLAALVLEAEAAISRAPGACFGGYRMNTSKGSKAALRLLSGEGLAAAALIHNAAAGRALLSVPYGDAADLLRRWRLLADGLAGGACKADVLMLPVIGMFCTAGCAAHLMVLWRGDSDRPLVIYDNRLSLSSLEEFQALAADDVQLRHTCGRARPLAELVGRISELKLAG